MEVCFGENKRVMKNSIVIDNGGESATVVMYQVIGGGTLCKTNNSVLKKTKYYMDRSKLSRA